MKKAYCLATLIALCCTVPLASATTILSNLPGSGTYTTTGSATLTPSFWEAVGITNSSGSAVTFTSLEGEFASTPGGTLDGGIYSDVSGNPGSLLAAFNSVGVSNNSNPTSKLLTTTSSFNLQNATSYWFVLHDAVPQVTWDPDNSAGGGTVPVASAGYSYNGFRFSTNTGASWTNDTLARLTVEITTVPEPASLTLLAAGAASLFLLRRRARHQAV
jgi:hypothetical protein